jgi:hypothetical protein
VAGKHHYTLFNPTPTELMRPLSADRPDATESPVTVDAGHIQIEASFFSYTHRDESGERVDAWTVFDTNFKLGLTNSTDLQVIFSAYNDVKSSSIGSPSTTMTGFGDIFLRLKINIWGNDGGRTAFGIMPVVKIPTGTELSNSHLEGGLIFPLAWDVTDSWGLGFMFEVDGVYDEADDRYHAEFVHTATTGFDIIGPVGIYLEYLGIASTAPSSEYQAIFSSGVTCSISDNLVLDAGAQAGLTDAADDVTVFSGFTFRY